MTGTVELFPQIVEAGIGWEEAYTCPFACQGWNLSLYFVHPENIEGG